MIKNEIDCVDQFFTAKRYSEKGKCFIAEKKLDNGYELSFYAKGETAADLSLLVRSIDAFSCLMRNWDSYVRLIFEGLEKKCPDYFDGASASDVLVPESLELTSIDVDNMNLARITFYDRSQTFGGHYVVADLDGGWNVTNVGLSDL